MKDCEYCVKRESCTRSTGAMFGGCNVEFSPDKEAIYKALDNLEGCQDNEIYAAKIKELRDML